MKSFVKGKLIGVHCCADDRREIYDTMNHQLYVDGVNPDCIFIGDSITEMWDLNNYFSEYGIIVNRGIGGDNIYGVLSRFDVDVIQHNPKLCAMMVGINDSWIIDSEVPSAEKKDGVEGGKKHIQDYIEKLMVNYEKILSKAQKAGLKMLVCSILPLRPLLDSSFDYKNYYVIEINKSIKALAEKYDFDYVDYFSNLVSKEGGLESRYSWDGVHPLGIAYIQMVKAIKPYLTKYLK